VSDRERWDLLGGALALVSPSPWEAFSLVVAEAWSCGTPVLVNAGCAATVEHCQRSGGGLTFAGFGQFEVEVDRLSGDAALRESLGRRGRAYVDRWFRWPQVIDRYAGFLQSVAAGSGALRSPVPGDGDPVGPPPARRARSIRG
jgi:glycosyltransferase involved in cell wall biosynthesis